MRLSALILLAAVPPAGADPLTLWYRQPAAAWTQALPVGNGRLAGMVFGGVEQERIQFNEHTVWTGEPRSYAHVGAAKYLPQIRQLLFDGKQAEAEKLATEQFMGTPMRQMAYQAFGDLLLDFSHSSPTDYRRELNLDTATAAVEYTAGGVTYRREVFSSWPDQVLVVRLSASRPGALGFRATLRSAHEGSAVTSLPSGDVQMAGRVADSAIRFAARLAVRVEGGRSESRNGVVTVTAADRAVLLLSGATNFVNYRDVSANPGARNQRYLAAASPKSFDALRAAHLADHQRLFRRVTLDLGTSADAALPTDERIARFATGSDPEVVALLFQYGRYLMIGSSRAGGQPANLQGIWNDSNKPAWDSKYTVNINTEMNYWPVEVTNLAECHTALFDALKDVAASGAVTAREHYNARGWVLHHNFDLWRGTAPINASNHGIWQTGGAWLAQHLWEHYLFGRDRAYLRSTAYPLMRGAALFFVDALVRHPQKDWMITGPSNSPEQGGLVMGPTMDHQIVRGLFGAVIAASEILGTDADLRRRLTDLRVRIAPNQIGRYGQLQEWLGDKDDPTNQHRHVSHLWGVFPGAEITSAGTPELFAAAQKSLEFRGDAATGWSMGWKMNLWARFLDGAHAYRILQNLVQPATDGGNGVRAKAGLFGNLFDAHPPFQIDGNFGATNGVAEMLLQSHDPAAGPTTLTAVQKGQAAVITLLPALPPAFSSGHVTGLRARGGIETGIWWSQGRLARVTLRATEAIPVKVRYAGKEIDVRLAAGRTLELTGALSAAR